MGYPSYHAKKTLMTKRSMTPSSCRRARRWRTPSTYPTESPSFQRGEEPLDEELDPRFRLRQYVDSKRRLVTKGLCYAKPTRRLSPLKQESVGDISQLKEDLEQKITTWQREVI